MPNLNLSEDEIKKLITFFKWVDAIDTNQWPPKPVAGGQIDRSCP